MDTPSKSEPKRQRTVESSRMTIYHNFGGLNVVQLFNKAMTFVNIIAFSQQFQDVISILIGEANFDVESFTATLSKAFTISASLPLRLLSAYAWTDPNEDFIYVNSQMLMNFALVSAADDSTRTLFLVVKILDELGHIVNKRSNKLFRGEKGILKTPLKVKSQTYKVKREKTDKVSEVTTDVPYSDFGEMLELELFGGMIEGTTESDNYMQIDTVITYSSSYTHFGNVVDCQASLQGFASGNFRLVAGDEYEATKKPAFRGVSANLPGIFLLAPGVSEEELDLPSNIRV